MKFLVLHNDTFEMMDNLLEVQTKALVATFEWCQDPTYEGSDWRELYNECMENADFGDIIKAYEIKPIKAKDFTEFNYCEVGDTFQLKRVL